MSRTKKPLIEANGKIESATPKTQPMMLEQVWGGYNELARYNTTDAREYESKLNEMTRSDLENHARKLGVMVCESSLRLKDKLRQEFSNYITTIRRPYEDPKKPIIATDEVRKILAEGR